MKKNKIKNNLFLIAFFLLVFFSSFVVTKYDKTSYSKFNIPYNELIKSDSAHYFLKAEIFKENLKSGRFLDLTNDYQASLFYPLALGYFYKIFNINLFDDNKINNSKVVNNTKIKILFLIFQSTIYLLSVLFLSKKMKKHFSKRIVLFSTLFLIFEPTIFQFHTLFMTEIFYLSFLNFLIGLIIDQSENIKINFLLGILIGIAYLIKTVSFLIIIPVIFYYIFVFKKKSYLPIISIILGYGLVILFLGYSNFQRSGIFYIKPTQSMDAPYWYMAHIIDARSKNISESEAYNLKINKEKEWIMENHLNLNLEKDRILLAMYKQKYSNKIFFENPIILSKYVIWKTFQFLIINPLHFYQYTKMSIDDVKIWKLPAFKTHLIICIFYSILLYAIFLVGIINLFYKKNKKIIYILIGLILYFVILMGWTGGSRYNLPLICLSSIFFSSGVVSIIDYLNLKIKFLK